jgi:outer membrane protein TolC
VILALLVAGLHAATPAAQGARFQGAPHVVPDTLLVVTLAEAIRRATSLDPDYVRAVGQVADAEWGRRAARLAFIIPSLTVSTDATKYSTEFFNVGTGQQQSRAVNARLNAGYEIFSSLKFSDLTSTAADLEGAQAGELDQRFRTALLTESDYYGVLRSRELSRVAAERLRRAQEQLGVARARVVSGAEVQSDSLQLVLEVTQSRISLVRQESALRIARLQLGRRIGAPTAVDAAPIDSVVPELAIGLPEAISAALDQGPLYRQARASERAAAADLRGLRGSYLPSVSLNAANTRFDDSFFPAARVVSAITLTVSLPLWDLGQREIGITRARVAHDVARAVRSDLERGVVRDVTEGFDAYETARQTIELAGVAFVAAREHFRVQDLRYRSGATTILDLLDAQFSLTQAEAEVVQARYAARLALAGIEVLLGRRLSPNKDVP